MKQGVTWFVGIFLFSCYTAVMSHTYALDVDRAIILSQENSTFRSMGGETSAKQQYQRTWPFYGTDPSKTELAENLLSKNIVLIYDGSGSMSEKKCSGNRTKIQVAREAVTEWLKTVPGETNVGLVSFHGNTWTKVPLQPGDHQPILKAIMTINPGGTTPLTEAFGFAYGMLTEQAKKQLGYGEYMIVVVTDGIANDPMSLARRVQLILEQTPILVYSIGFCIDERHTLNQPGRTIYRTANNPEALRKGFQQVLAEMESFDAASSGK